MENVSNDTLVTVENMTSIDTGYVLDDGTRRRFHSFARMNLPTEELRQCVYQHGNYLFTNVLRICNDDLAAEFGIPEDMVEYKWTKSDIDEAITTMPLDEFLDAVDFGPTGIVEEMARQAVEREITDGERIKALNTATGLNIQQQIVNKHAYDNASAEEESKTSSRRRVASKDSGRKRRVSVTK